MNTMSAGTYYIGDLCYVMHDEWGEFCNITIDGSECKDGVFQLKNGKTFATFGTAYGDGVYSDNIGREYGVDAGLIGCILLSDIDQTNPDNMARCGHIHTFDTDFVVSEENGIIKFGSVSINTEYEEDDGEADYE